MNAVDRTKAGAASGVLSMFRMVGGTFGVAIMGALVTTVGSSKLTQLLPDVPAATRSRIADALGSGAGLSHHAPARVIAAVHEAFISALSTGLTVTGSVAVVGAFLAVVLIRRSVAVPAPQAAAGPGATGAAAPVPLELPA